MAAAVEKLIARAERMKSARSTLDGHLQEIRDYLLPLSAGFTSSTDMPGAKGRQKVFDNSGETAAEIFAGALHGLLTNPGARWHGLRPDLAELLDDEEVAAWVEGAAETMFDVYDNPASGFATAMAEIYPSFGDYGTVCMYVAERPGRVPLFQARPLGEIYIAENHEGKIDTVFRRFKMTARKAVQKWGPRAGEKVNKAAADPKKADDEFDFLHCVYPRADRLPGRLGAANMAIASVYISLADKSLVAAGGYFEMPFIVARWSKRSGEVYGRGPGMKALADVKMLQRAMKVTIKGTEKVIDPTLMVADDGVIGPVRSGANAIITVRPEVGGRRAAVEPLITGGRPDLGEQFMAGVRQRIADAYFKSLLRLPRDPRMTATQFLDIKEEVFTQLGPFLGRVQNELLGPFVDRTFAILLRQGAFGPPPAVLEGRQILVKYESPAAKALRIAEVRAIAQLNEVSAPMAAMDPSIVDNLDADAAYRLAADRLGVPRALLRGADQVEAMRRARAEEAQKKAATEQIAALAPAAQSAGQAVAAFAQAGQGQDGQGEGNAP